MTSKVATMPQSKAAAKAARSGGVLGAALAVVSWLLSPDVLSTIHDPRITAVGIGIGTILAVFGITKNVHESGGK